MAVCRISVYLTKRSVTLKPLSYPEDADEIKNMALITVTISLLKKSGAWEEISTNTSRALRASTTSFSARARRIHF